MNGEEVAGPAGPKVARLLYFVGAGFICTIAINQFRAFQKKQQQQKQLQQQQQQLHENLK